MKPNLIKALLLVLLAPWVSHTVRFQPDENKFSRVAEIPLPAGYTRIAAPENSFGAWLRNLRLKKDKRIFLFNGQLKADQDMQFAVIDLPIGTKDLQQCADAVMRLRADFLRSQGKWNEIRFTDNNGDQYAPDGVLNEMDWQKWLERVFAHCGTLSLQKQLTPAKGLSQCSIGTVLIQGGSPGHAMIIADMAENVEGKKIYLLAQGYMPAQDIHIVINPNVPGLSPWYELQNGPVVTPAWAFPKGSFRIWELTR
jgi:Domain of unknown function (4846)